MSSISKLSVLGHEYVISKEELEQKMLDLEPEMPPRPRLHVAKIGGRMFPIKQAILAVTGLTDRMITTLEAYKVLEELGYRIWFSKSELLTKE